MNYADIKRVDVANGEGVRVSIFVSGCNHHCKGCFNECAWDFKYGKEFTKNEQNEIVNYLGHDYIEGLTLLGGEPLEKVNQEGLLPLVKEVKEKYPGKTIWCYTGFDFEKDVMGKMLKTNPVTNQLVKYLDVVVDGKFQLENKNPKLRFRCSSNQRIIDVQETLKTNKIVEINKNYTENKNVANI